MAMIKKKLIHFNSFADFNTKKLSANADNTKYTEGVSDTIVDGEPDIMYQSIVYIKDALEIWTHGQIYDCDSFISDEEDTELEDIDPNVVTKVSELEIDLSKKQDKMLNATEIAATGLVTNTKYTLGEISSLDLTTIPANNKDGILIYFSTASTGCTLTYTAATNWYGTDAPTVEASKSYVVLIADGVCGIKEYNPQTA